MGTESNLKNLFCCPYCHGELIEFQNFYRCDCCSLRYKYEHNIYYFFNPNASHWQKLKLTNINAWEEVDKNKDYEYMMARIDFPYLMEGRDIASSANGAMLTYTYESISGSLSNGDKLPILNIGVGSCWESYFFARYKPVIAMNVYETVRWINPGFGKGIIRVVCDGAYLPIKDESVGMIFMCSTYHHFEDKSRALEEWCRVLIPNGILVAIGENPGPFRAEESPQADIGEFAYTFAEMKETFRNSPFRAIENFPVQYSENMEYKQCIELTGTNPDNGIIIGVK